MTRLILIFATIPILGCGSFCGRSVAEFCASTACPATPQAARDCSKHPRVSEGRCGALTQIEWGGVDSATRFYFDDSGKLVAVVEFNANGGGSEQCGGGPAYFDPPACSDDVKRDCP